MFWYAVFDCGISKSYYYACVLYFVRCKHVCKSSVCKCLIRDHARIQKVFSEGSNSDYVFLFCFVFLVDD